MVAILTSTMVVIVECRRGSKLKVVGSGVEVAIVDGDIVVVAHHDVGVEEAGKGRGSDGIGREILRDIMVYHKREYRYT